MRATAENPLVAGLMGVNINRIISATFVIGSALPRSRRAGQHQLRHRPLLHGLHARPESLHRGGAGRHRQLGGAMLGGLLLGLIESIGAGYIGDLMDFYCRVSLIFMMNFACEAGGFVLSAATTRTCSPSWC